MAGFWALTNPQPLEITPVFGQSGDPEIGRIGFSVGGCALVAVRNLPRRLARSQAQYFPDIETGIGGWSAYDLANAVIKGFSPEDKHYYPALPYGSYARMSIEDAIDQKPIWIPCPPSAKPMPATTCRCRFAGGASLACGSGFL